MEDQKGYETAVRQATTPEISIEIIKKYICPKATDQEAYTFLQLCKLQNLNPFLKEAYLIKYGDEAATIVIGKDTFTKRADRLPQYDGFKAGIIVNSSEKVIRLEGSFFVYGESLLGGWAEVFRKDRSNSFRNEVSLLEYERHKKDGSLMSNWKTMPATMIRKVALVQSLREAFPEEFGGQYSPEEMEIDDLPVYRINGAPVYPVPAPLKEPGKKSEKPPAPATMPNNKITHVRGVEAKVEAKDGEKDGKPYTIYGITDEDGQVYKTFDKKLADFAEDVNFIKDAAVNISYTTSKYGNTLVSIENCPKASATSQEAQE